MRTLCPRNHRRGSSSGSPESRLHLDRAVLATQTHTGVPVVASRPVPPEERGRADREGMEQDTHLARCGRGTSIPLARRTFGTGTAVADAGRRDDPQAALTLATGCMKNQPLACGTSHGPIGVKRNVGAGKAGRFPGGRRGGRSRARGTGGSCEWGWTDGCLPSGFGKGRGKRRRAYPFRDTSVPHRHSPVPGPRGDDRPGFLSPGRVATPAIWFWCLVFVLERRFKGPAMQGEGDSIPGGQGPLGKSGPEAFRDASVTEQPDLAFLFLGCRGRGRRHQETNGRSLWRGPDRRAGAHASGRRGDQAGHRLFHESHPSSQRERRRPPRSHSGPPDERACARRESGEPGGTPGRFPCRSHHPAACSSGARGRAPRSKRKRVRKASTGEAGSAAQKRLSVEAVGTRARPNTARKADAK
jgi:hypothetical protein